MENKTNKNNNNNNALILVLSIIISFICGTLGSYIVITKVPSVSKSIVENVSILNVYDIYGKEVPMEKIENVDNLFLVCKVNKNLSVLINNLKYYGKFNLSIGR